MCNVRHIVTKFFVNSFVWNVRGEKPNSGDENKQKATGYVSRQYSISC